MKQIYTEEEYGNRLRAVLSRPESDALPYFFAMCELEAVQDIVEGEERTERLRACRHILSRLQEHAYNVGVPNDSGIFRATGPEYRTEA